MNVLSVLKSKGSSVVTASPEDTILQLAEALAEHNIGAMIVTDAQDNVVGIVSERDVVRKFSSSAGDCGDVLTKDIMTSKVLTCTPEDSLDNVMDTMTSKRIRHLPVMNGGKLGGIITIGDVVKFRLEEVKQEAEEMKRYIAG